MKNRQTGFIALISAIIISVLLLTITFTVSMTGLWGRFNILDAESKERSSNLAEACADIAILNLAQSQPQPLNPVHVESDECNIVSITPGSQTTIKTQAIINKAYTNLVVVINSDYSIVSWNEVLNF